jgi:HD-like signal output (HDOD) protein
MDAEVLKAKLGEKVNVPSLPRVVVEVQHLMADPDVGMSEIGRKIALDPPLTAKLLRTANSAYYALKVPVVSVEHAAALLGLHAIRDLVMQISLMDKFSRIGRGTGFDLHDLWRHSILTGQVASLFPRSDRWKIGKDELYLCGLLHDIGQFAMLDSLGEEFVAVYQRARDEGRSQERVEQEVFGFTHTEVGALIALRWNLPESTARCVRYHHDLHDRAARDHAIGITAVSNVITTALAENKLSQLARQIPRDVANFLQLEGPAIEKLVKAAAELREQLSF